MNFNEMKESKYVKKEDVGNGIIVTIKTVTNENIGMENQPADMKWVLTFVEDIKPLILNWTNIQLCAQATGQEDTDSWAGNKIVLYNDHNVSYQGKLIGGVRIRPNQDAAPAQVASTMDAAPTGPIDEDSMPAF